VEREPQLLVSLHDVSPLTLPACRDAVDLLCETGVPSSSLTLLVVPFHRAQIELDAHPDTVRFVHDLADRGATLVAHGYTHEMDVAPRSPLRWLAARWFARGEGELAASAADDTEHRLDRAHEIFARAGLASRMVGFVPPAWMLSRGAASVVAARGFPFCETFGGIGLGERVLARRLIGWGSLTAIEAVATSVWARLQTRRSPADTRLAVHPPDVRRPSTRRSLIRTLRVLLERHRPVSYATYLADA